MNNDSNPKNVDLRGPDAAWGMIVDVFYELDLWGDSTLAPAHRVIEVIRELAQKAKINEGNKDFLDAVNSPIVGKDNE